MWRDYLAPLVNGTRAERLTWFAYHLFLILFAVGFWFAWQLWGGP